MPCADQVGQYWASPFSHSFQIGFDGLLLCCWTLSRSFHVEHQAPFEFCLFCSQDSLWSPWVWLHDQREHECSLQFGLYALEPEISSSVRKTNHEYFWLWKREARWILLSTSQSCQLYVQNQAANTLSFWIIIRNLKLLRSYQKWGPAGLSLDRMLAYPNWSASSRRSISGAHPFVWLPAQRHRVVHFSHLRAAAWSAHNSSSFSTQARQLTAFHWLPCWTE